MNATRRAALGLGVIGIPAVAMLTTKGISSTDTLNPDAELIALCARFAEMERQIGSYFLGGANYVADEEIRDAAIEPIETEQEALLDRMCDLRATTVAGFQARARTLLLVYPGQARDNPENGLDQRLCAALLRDLAGRA